MKKIVSMVLALALALSLGATTLAAESGAGSMENFKPQRTYGNQFTDVKQGDFCYEGVKLCYELGIMNGVSDTKFAPNQNISYGQLMIIAARLRNLYVGGTGEFPIKAPDYDLYKNAEYYLITELGPEYQNPSSGYGDRWQLGVFGVILGEDAYTPINSLTVVPDFMSIPDYYTGMNEGVLRLYNAGILTGSDEYGTFYAFTEITRGAVATIISRIVDPSQRKVLNLKEGLPPIKGVINMRWFMECPNMMAWHDANPEQFTDVAYSKYEPDRWVVYDDGLVLKINSRGSNGYEISGLSHGAFSEKQHELIKAFLKDTTEHPDAIYEKFQEYYTARSSGNFSAWKEDNMYKETRIGSIIFQWEQGCESFSIRNAA